MITKHALKSVCVYVNDCITLIVVAGSFNFSDESCKMWITGDLFFCNSACLHLAFVNMDAFLRLKDPRHRRGRRVVTVCSLLLWIGAPWSVSFVQVCLHVALDHRTKTFLLPSGTLCIYLALLLPFCL